MRADSHVHTEFSDDSAYPMAQVAKDALELGLEYLCFTDHVDYGIKPDWNTPEAAHPKLDPDLGKPVLNVNYPAYFEIYEQVRSATPPQLELAVGLELGVQMCTLEQNCALVERYGSQLDFALLSIHQVNNQESWTGEMQAGRTQDQYYDLYYDELIAVMEAFDGYDALAHLDLARRYDHWGARDFAKDRQKIAAVLELAIAHDKAVELNTSSWRYGLGDLTPARDIWRLYRDLGGELVTIGSDSHAPGQLAAHLDDAHRELRELGFKEFVTYRHHVPREHGL